MIILPLLLEKVMRMQDFPNPEVIESTSSNPGLVIGAAILVAIVIGGMILHSYSPKIDSSNEDSPKED